MSTPGLKIHYEKYNFGSDDAIITWKKEGIIPDKVKFCDGRMLKKGRECDFTADPEKVTCKKCRQKIKKSHNNS
jgi:uncharacterized paraquat-inducible protein A